MTENFFMKYTFDCFVEMSNVLRGWNIEIRQLQEGKIHDTLKQLKVKNILFSYAEFSGLTHQLGDIPPGRTFAFYTGKSSQLIWRKKDIPFDAMMIFPLNSKLDVVVKGSKTNIHTISVSEEDLLSRLQENERDIYNSLVSTKDLITMHPSQMKNLQEVYGKYIQSAEENPDLINEKNFQICLEEELFTALIDVLLCEGNIKHSATKERIVQSWDKLEMYIETHKQRPIMLSELSKATDIGQRSIFRLFKDRFNLTPKAYLNKLRLNGVRNDITQMDFTKNNITDIARNWGFWHMGQFAADYKRLFGELPSETLQSA